MKTDPDEVYVIYFFLFLQFDRNSNSVLDLEDFIKSATKRMMLDVAEELGLLPL